MNAVTLRRYRWHRSNGGTAQYALRCARAEALLEEAEELGVVRVEWEYEQERYEDIFGFETDAEREKFYRDLDSNTITGPFWAGLYVEDEIVASLGMVMFGPRGTDDPYARDVVAELVIDSEDEIRQAIGDKLDRLEGALD